jgi:hypothetical protein
MAGADNVKGRPADPETGELTRPETARAMPLLQRVPNTAR